MDPSNLLIRAAGGGEFNSNLAQHHLTSQLTNAHQFDEITAKLNMAKFLNTFTGNLNRPILHSSSNTLNHKTPPVFNHNNHQHTNNGFNFMQTLLAANNLLKIQNSSFPQPPHQFPAVNNTSQQQQQQPPTMFNFNGSLPPHGGLNFNASLILEQIKSLSKSNLKGELKFKAYLFKFSLSCPSQVYSKFFNSTMSHI
jgi:hypothetical protein